MDPFPVLIAGCGYVGTVLADILIKAGHPVIALTGSRDSARELAASVDYPVHACDLGDAVSVKCFAGMPVVKAAPVGAIVHCASSGRGGEESYRRVYLDGMCNLVAAFPQAHPVFTSSTSVYPQSDGSEVDEDSITDPDRPTGKILREAEVVALGAGGAAVRLAGIYGSDRWYLVKKFLEGTATLEVSEDAPDGRYVNSIHREDAASALAFVARNRLPGIFNAADSTPHTQRAAYQLLSEHFSKPMPPESPPDLDRKRGWTHKRVSNHKLVSAGWNPKFSSIENAL